MTNPLINSSGTLAWYVGGIIHRTDGPARIHKSGTQVWYVNGKRFNTNKSYQEAAGLSDEEMTVLVLKYGNVE
jgi:hypothetical protein